MSDGADSDAGLMYRDWAIALGATTAVFLVTTLVLASILFVILCRKIARLRKERKSRVTGVLQGVTSPHWIDHTNLGDMLAHEESDHGKPTQNIWTISTQTFDTSRAQQPSAAPQNESSVVNARRETDERDKSSSVAISPTVDRQNVKPNRSAPSPPKIRKKLKSHSGKIVNEGGHQDEATPYVYPLHKVKQESATNGNQSHEYAQPHVCTVQARVHDKETAQNGKTKKKHEYLAIDPKLKQPTGQYQDLLQNGLPRGSSLPAMSTLAAMNS